MFAALGWANVSNSVTVQLGFLRAEVSILFLKAITDDGEMFVYIKRETVSTHVY